MAKFKTITQRRRERLAAHGEDLLAEFQRLFCRHGHNFKLGDQDSFLARCDSLAADLDNLDSQSVGLAQSAWFAATSAASILRSYAQEDEMKKIDEILNLETT